MALIFKALWICLILQFAGCAIDLSIDTEWGLVKTNETGFYTEKWYRNPDIKESKMLGSSTSDYGAAAEKKRHQYIIKYFDNEGKEIPQKDLRKIKSSRKFWRSYLTREQYMESKKRNFERNLKNFVFSDDNMTEEELKNIRSDFSRTRVSWTRAEYIKNAQKSIKVDDWEDDPNQFYYIKDKDGEFIKKSHISVAHLSYIVVPIKQCFGNGWCEVYPSRREHQTTFYVKESALLDFEVK
ncbi:MAG: hypothetical protein EOL95_11805 [Bacteroidia bacterium]|nr:hypothetical protein [Bacteroidia bacterium]